MLDNRVPCGKPSHIRSDYRLNGAVYYGVPSGTLILLWDRIGLSVMDRVAVFVDAGYLFAPGSKELCGERLARGNIALDHSVLCATLTEFAERISGLPLLRIYWYDGTSQGPSAQHITLADQPGIKVRLGLVNQRGQQKGVDSLVVTDMLTLARNRAMAECVLLSGDEDLRVGVQQAQEYGVRVHLLGIRPARGSQSVLLLQEADSTHEWTTDDLRSFLDCRPVVAPPVAPSEEKPLAVTSGSSSEPILSTSSILRSVAREVASEVASAEITSLVAQIQATNRRPPELDGRLLARSRASVGRDLDTSQKSEVRADFLNALVERMESAREDSGDST